MSGRAWVVLIGLLVLSILVAGVTTWALNRPPTPLPRLPLIGPAYGIPVGGRIPPHPPLRPPKRPLPGESPQNPPAIRNRWLLPPRLPWRHPLFTRPRPVWQIGRVLASEIFLFLVIVITVFLFPRRIKRSLQAFTDDAGVWMPLAVGFTSSIIMTVLTLLSAFSALGLVLLPWILVLFGFLWAIGLVIATLQLGRLTHALFRIPDRTWVLDAMLGVLTLVTLGILPLIGWIFFVLCGFWGMGTVVLTRFGSAHGWEFDITMEERP